MQRFSMLTICLLAVSTFIATAAHAQNGHFISASDVLVKYTWRDDLNLRHFIDQPMLELDLGRSGLRRDKWDEAQHSQHNEFYWRMRAWRPLTFLFPP